MSAQASPAALVSPEEGAPAHVRRLAALLFALLVIGSFAAFFVAQRLKHTPTAIQQLYVDPTFYPQGEKVPSREAVSFKIEHSDEVTVTIVQAASGAAVATLVRHRPLASYSPFKVTWNGDYGAHRDGAAPPTGPPAPPGEYRVQVSLARQHITRYSPLPFTLVRAGKS